ncbi:HTH-type transcriptional regulator DmlR [bioreactor metagenome]|uniref:HTH-type transcriptional regulator DmlR n=1 Tax=bioreactor metagenome TaxID=1076179 RepID=A0A645A5Y1_9ZZZZ
MDRLQAMRMFRAVVEMRGFTAAADELGTTHSTASRQVKELEAALQVQLLHRNTRGVTLTHKGERYYRTCVEVLNQLDEAESALSHDHSGDVRGMLRLSLPLAVGVLELDHWLPAFMQRYPGIALDLQCTDRLVDVVAEGIDVALRISASLQDSGLVARKLTESPMVLVASPSYVARHGLVQDAAQLQEHRLIVYATDRKPVNWTLYSNAQPVRRFAVTSALRTDTIASAFAAASAGMGIATFTMQTVHTAIERGQLVQVLPQVHLGQLGYHCLYPASRHVQPAVRAFVDHMAQHYRQPQH